MKTIRAVISDNDEEYRCSLKSCMADHNIICVGEASDGESTLELIMSAKPDIVVTDLFMSHIDGAEIIRESKRLLGKKCPLFFIAASVCTKEMLEEAIDCGALYCVKKPVSARVVCTRILRLMELGDILNNDNFYDDGFVSQRSVAKSAEENAEEIEREITDTIRKFGIPANLKGFTYLRRAIILFIKHGNSSRYSKDIYLKIATNFSSTTPGVERAISHSIEYAWNCEKTDTFMELCEEYHFSPYKKPKNKEFISSIADAIMQRIKHRKYDKLPPTNV